MNRFFLAAALAAGCIVASSTSALAAAKNYDCSKAGNANKAACKGTPKPAKAAVKPVPAANATPAKTATTTKSVTRTYDCTKAGNANKAQCKSSTTAASSVTKPAPTAKAAPAPAQPSLLQRMKNAMSGTSTPGAKPTPAAKPAPRRTAAAASASVEDKNPAGAIAQCKDGTYSHAKARTGACSRHGGVGKWN